MSQSANRVHGSPDCQRTAAPPAGIGTVGYPAAFRLQAGPIRRRGTVYPQRNCCRFMPAPTASRHLTGNVIHSSGDTLPNVWRPFSLLPVGARQRSEMDDNLSTQESLNPLNNIQPSAPRRPTPACYARIRSMYDAWTHNPIPTLVPPDSPGIGFVPPNNLQPSARTAKQAKKSTQDQETPNEAIFPPNPNKHQPLAVPKPTHFRISAGVLHPPAAAWTPALYSGRDVRNTTACGLTL